MKPIQTVVPLLLAGSALLVSTAAGATVRSADAARWARAGEAVRLAAATALERPVGTLPIRPFPIPRLAIRKSITALTPAEVASLRKGFAQMIAWNDAPRGSANFKRSLRYWANIHSFIGPNAPPSVICSPKSGLTRPGMNGITAQAPTTPDEQATWCTCQHGTVQFLTWHRMYLYYFEQVLRAAAGDPTLHLPFWDYETDGHLPDAYRLPTYTQANGTTAANPLYVASRQAQLANGSQGLASGVTTTAGAMPAKDYNTFDDALEDTPHGAVHCATGVASCPSGYMGYVPTAGNDPIFYSHHANIDRLYECWLRVDPTKRLPDPPAQLAQTFSFIDGAGNLVTRRVGDMLTTAQLHYGYTAGGGCPTPARFSAFIGSNGPVRSIPLAGATALQRGTTSVPLRSAPDARSALLSAAAPPSGLPTAHATLVIEGLTFDEVPAALYDVYLQGADGKRVQVGVINFFNATAPHHDTMPGMAATAPAERRFDATQALATLGSANGATLVIEPATGLTGSNVAEASRGISAAANVRFSAVRIDVQ